MLAPQTPVDESDRLSSLRRMLLLETPDEEVFDRVTRLAQQIFGVPIALVSLVDENRQWFKSCIGLPVRETPRDISFCGHAILKDDLFVIADTYLDERFSDNPLVTGAPFIRFYAGYPLRNIDGYNIGTLCIIDSQPHQFSLEKLSLLEDLGACVESAMRLRELSDSQRVLLEELDYIKHQALVCPLLRIWNAEGIKKIFATEFNRTKSAVGKIGLMAISINQYKNLLYAAGEITANEFLVNVVKKIRRQLPEGCILGRKGEDELLLITPQMPTNKLISLGNALRTDVSSGEGFTLLSYPQNVKASLSIGVASVDIATYKGSFDSRDMLSAADQALFIAKSVGDNQQEVLIFDDN